MPKVYLDYAATTPIDPKVLRAVMPYLRKEFGNPSSIHAFGQKAMSAVDSARQITANFLGCQPAEIIFTGSATEADNLAIFGSVKKGDQSANRSFASHKWNYIYENKDAKELGRLLGI